MLSHYLIYIVPSVIYVVPFDGTKWDKIYHKGTVYTSEWDNIYQQMGKFIPANGTIIPRNGTTYTISMGQHIPANGTVYTNTWDNTYTTDWDNIYHQWDKIYHE